MRKRVAATLGAWASSYVFSDEYLGGLEALAEAHRDELRVKQALAAGLWACPEGAGAEVDELVALFAAGPCVDEREVQFLLDRGLAEPDRDG